MKFNSVHGSNIILELGGSRAVRVSSFCDAIAFSHKPLPVNSRVSVTLGTNEEWSGALRLGVTAKDPATIGVSGLPRYACPDLISKRGFWARPIPEKWALNGNRLTFYVSSQGHFQLFVNNEHKGALLSGLPVKERLWLIFDLYGITYSITFVATPGNAPVEVLARGPEALRVYQQACADGSVSSSRSRLALIGCECREKMIFKKLLLNLASSEVSQSKRKAIDCSLVCQTDEEGNGKPWKLVTAAAPPSVDALMDELYDSDDSNSSGDDENFTEEEYYRAIAKNIVREIILQKKRKKQEERKKTALVRGALKLQSNISRKSFYGRRPEASSFSFSYSRTENGNGKPNDSIPEELPRRLVELVEQMLAEAETKQDWDKMDNEKRGSLMTTPKAKVTMNVWDFHGHPKYFCTHQVFLSPKTLYVLTINVNKDPDDPVEAYGDWKGTELPEGPVMTVKEWLNAYMSAIHASVARSASNVDTEVDGAGDAEGSEAESESDEKSTMGVATLQPYVLVIGLFSGDNEEKKIEKNLNKIKEYVSSESYGSHVLPTYYLVDCGDPDEACRQVKEIRLKIEKTVMELPHVMMEVPLKWLAFERMLDRLLERNIYMVDLMQLFEAAHREGMDDERAFISMIEFYHQQGKLLHFETGSAVCGGFDHEDRWSNTVFLKPQWFVDHAYQVFAMENADTKTDKGAIVSESLVDGVISETLMDRVFPDFREQRTILLGVLEDLDLICEVESSEMFVVASPVEEKSYLVPWNIGSDVMDMNEEPESPCSFSLIIDFHGLLPTGLFTRLVTRICRWSERHHWQREPQVQRRKSRIAVDREYDIVIKLQANILSRIEVDIVKADGAKAELSREFVCNAKHICAKVRHLLENELEALRDIWFNRVSFTICVPCPCDKECKEHGLPRCAHEPCLHFISLNQCLSNNVVMCDFRRVKTEFIRKYFPEASVLGVRNMGKRDSYSSKESTLMPPTDSHANWDAHSRKDEEPSWLVSVVKMLKGSSVGKDWRALAKRLGYGDRDTLRFEEDINPSVILLRDWMDSNAGTRYSVDILLFALEQMGREDIADVIRLDLEPEEPAPPIFISYQWDSQAAVLGLRRRLEMAGFPCWMDVGQMGGGDSLYGKIYEGISRAKVVICCLTPRYVISQTSTREASLADVLRKPILPVMLDAVPWPPPGPLAVVFSPLVYIALCGIGGHGGNGRQADWESRFQEIVNRLSQYVMPIPGFNHVARPGASLSHSPSLGPIGEDFGLVEERSVREAEGIMDEGVFDGDRVSTYSEESVQRRGSPPPPWRPSRPDHNTVSRCAVCVIL